MDLARKQEDMRKRHEHKSSVRARSSCASVKNVDDPDVSNLRFWWWDSGPGKSKSRFKLGVTRSIELPPDYGNRSIRVVDEIHRDNLGSHLPNSSPLKNTFSALLYFPHLNHDDIYHATERVMHGTCTADGFRQHLEDDIRGLSASLEAAHGLIWGNQPPLSANDDMCNAISRSTNHIKYLRLLLRAAELNDKENAPAPIDSKTSPRRDVSTYFIHAPTANAVKIGISCNVNSRLSSLQTSSAERLTLLATIPGDQEFDLHSKFQEVNMSGEWFSAPPVMEWLHSEGLYSSHA